MEQKFAQAYKTHSLPQLKRGERLMQIADIQEGQTILDLGCGTGELTYRLAKTVSPLGSVIGVDPNIERIRIAKDTYKRVENLNFYEGDCCNFPTKQKYDCIFSNYVLNWIPGNVLAEGMRRFFTALKPGGKFVFLVPHVDIPSPLDEVLETLPAEKLKTFWEKVILRSENELTELSENAGFKVVNLREDEVEYFYSSEEEILRWMVSSHPGLFHVEDVDMKKFKEIQFRKNARGEIRVTPKLYLFELTKSNEFIEQ